MILTISHDSDRASVKDLGTGHLVNVSMCSCYFVLSTDLHTNQPRIRAPRFWLNQQDNQNMAILCNCCNSSHVQPSIPALIGIRHMPQIRQIEEDIMNHSPGRDIIV